MTTSKIKIIPNKLQFKRGEKPGSIEIYFADSPPDMTETNELKQAGFQFSHNKNCWFGPEGGLPNQYKFYII